MEVQVDSGGWNVFRGRKKLVDLPCSPIPDLFDLGGGWMVLLGWTRLLEEHLNPASLALG